MRRVRFLLALAVLLVAAQAAIGQVRLPSIFGDHMVLQRDMRLPVWGTARPGELVTVDFGGSAKVTTADSEGRWKLKIGPFAASDAGRTLQVIAPSGSVNLQDVLVGDVWVGSGQSNMEMSVGGVRNAADEIAQADYPRIRLFTVAKDVALEPKADVRGEWQACTPQAVPGFSAVLYFFGRDLHKKLGVPIGLIHTSWGGTPAESWTPHKWLEGDPDLSSMLTRIPGQLDTTANRQNPWIPTGLWNAMVAPIVPFGIKGAIWYQGESNAGRAYQYRKLFPAMIKGWREAWGEGDFPFFFVQLANFTPQLPQPAESDWAELREAQSMTLKLPKTGMAVIIDIGEADNIHPKNKQDVGKRLALEAERIAYGDRGVISRGPMYRSMRVSGGKAILRFSDVDGGLTTRADEPLKGFAIAGDDHKFVWADARIVGDTVEASSPQVARPAAVRYGWANNPDCNLYNKAGLPASPFRTDQWPGVTVGKR